MFPEVAVDLGEALAQVLDLVAHRRRVILELCDTSLLGGKRRRWRRLEEVGQRGLGRLADAGLLTLSIAGCSLSSSGREIVILAMVSTVHTE